MFLDWTYNEMSQSEADRWHQKGQRHGDRSNSDLSPSRNTKKLAKQSHPKLLVAVHSCIITHSCPKGSYPAEIWVCESFGHSTCKNSDSQNSPQDSKAIQKKLPSTWGVHPIRSLLYPGEGGQPRLRVAKPREEMLGVWGNQGSCCGTWPNH